MIKTREAMLTEQYKKVIRQQEELSKQKQDIIEAMAQDCARHYNRIFGKVKVRDDALRDL